MLSLRIREFLNSVIAFLQNEFRSQLAATTRWSSSQPDAVRIQTLAVHEQAFPSLGLHQLRDQKKKCHEREDLPRVVIRVPTARS